jgi:hypothetical protein
MELYICTIFMHFTSYMIFFVYMKKCNCSGDHTSMAAQYKCKLDGNSTRFLLFTTIIYIFLRKLVTLSNLHETTSTQDPSVYIIFLKRWNLFSPLQINRTSEMGYSYFLLYFSVVFILHILYAIIKLVNKYVFCLHKYIIITNLIKG